MPTEASRASVPPLLSAALVLATTVMVSACDLLPSEARAGDCTPDSLSGTVENGVYVFDWDASCAEADSFTLYYSYSLHTPIPGGHEAEEVNRWIENAVPPVTINYLDSMYYTTADTPESEAFEGKSANLHWRFQHIWVELVAVVDGEDSDGVGDEFKFPFPFVISFYDDLVLSDEGDVIRARYNLEAPFNNLPEAGGWTDSVTVYWDTSPGITTDSPNRHTFKSSEETVSRTTLPGVSHYYRAIGYSDLGSSGLSPEVKLSAVRP